MPLMTTSRATQTPMVIHLWRTQARARGANIPKTLRSRCVRCHGGLPPSSRRHRSQVAGVPTIAAAMHLSLILDMAAVALGDRRAVTAPDGTITYAELRERADAL